MGIFGPYLYNYLFIDKSKQENLILLGSGTVIQYLKQYEELTKKVHFLDGPSGAAFDILLGGKAEEDYLQMIAMASTRFNENYHKNRNCNNKIVEVELPIEDNLKIIIALPKNKQDSTNFKKYLYKDYIELKDILGLITSDSLDFELYLTTENSGTRITYQEEFCQLDSSFHWPSEKVEIYDLNSSTSNTIKNNKKPCVILTSKLYKVDSLGYETGIINNGEILFRKLYLYFIKRDCIDYSNGLYTFNNQYIEGEFVEDLMKNINADYKLTLLNTLNNDIIKFQMK